MTRRLKPSSHSWNFQLKFNSLLQPLALLWLFLQVFKPKLKDVHCYVAQNSNFGETGSYFMEKNVLWFSLWCPTAVIHRGSWKQHAGCLKTEAAAAAAGRVGVLSHYQRKFGSPAVGGPVQEWVGKVTEQPWLTSWQRWGRCKEEAEGRTETVSEPEERQEFSQPAV